MCIVVSCNNHRTLSHFKKNKLKTASICDNCPSHFEVKKAIAIFNNSIILCYQRFDIYLTYFVNIIMFSKT